VGIEFKYLINLREIMSTPIRKYGIILVVAILFSIFVFSLGNALLAERTYPAICEEAQPQRDYYSAPMFPRDQCPELPPPSQDEIEACPGTLNPDWRSNCPDSYVCNCYELSNQYQKQEATIQFWLAVFLGFIAIVAGMMLPARKEINEWVGAGFILGGLITLFIATAQYWSEIHRIARPIVIALELVVVLWIAYRQFNKEQVQTSAPKKKK